MQGYLRFRARKVKKRMKTAAKLPSLKFSDAVTSGVLGPTVIGATIAALVLTAAFVLATTLELTGAFVLATALVLTGAFVLAAVFVLNR